MILRALRARLEFANPSGSSRVSLRETSGWIGNPRVGTRSKHSESARNELEWMRAIRQGDRLLVRHEFGTAKLKGTRCFASSSQAAEGAGFEPARPEVCQFSRLVDSAALPPLLFCARIIRAQAVGVTSAWVRSMVPPPSSRSPSYKTASWPGVMARSGSSKVSWKRLSDKRWNVADVAGER